MERNLLLESSVLADFTPWWCSDGCDATNSTSGEAKGGGELCFDSNFIDILEPLNFHVLYHVPNTVVDGEMDACDALLSYFNTRRVSYNHLPS